VTVVHREVPVIDVELQEDLDPAFQHGIHEPIGEGVQGRGSFGFNSELEAARGRRRRVFIVGGELGEFGDDPVAAHFGETRPEHRFEALAASGSDQQDVVVEVVRGRSSSLNRLLRRT